MALLPRLLTAIVVLWEYVSLLAVPVHLAADYSFNQIPIVLTLLDPRFLLAVAGLFGAALSVALISRRKPEVLAAALLFLVPLGLTANVLFPIGTIKAERLLYLPSLGWCLGLGCLADAAARAKRRIWIPAFAALVAALGARTWLRNPDWRNDLVLFTVTAQASPASAKAHHNVAVALERAGQLDEAMDEFRESFAIYPQYPGAAFGIGHVYSLKGLDGPALHWYEKAVRLDWGFAKAHLQIGLLRERLREYDTAEAAFRAGLAGDPDNALLLVNLSATRLEQGDRWGSLRLLARLDALGPVAPDVADLVAAARREIEAGGARMKIFAIALNTFREAIRNRILYSILFFALVVVGIASVFGAASIGDQMKFIKDFSLMSISLFGVIIAIVLGVTMLHQELRKRTILNILSKPVARWEFVAGKFLGMLATLALIVGLMSAGLLAFLSALEGHFDWGLASRLGYDAAGDHGGHRGGAALLVPGRDTGARRNVHGGHLRRRALRRLPAVLFLGRALTGRADDRQGSVLDPAAARPASRSRTKWSTASPWRPPT